MFVPNFIILCQAVPEKSLTEKKFTHTHTHARTQTSSQKRQKLYTPYILRICRGYNEVVDTDILLMALLYQMKGVMRQLISAFVFTTQIVQSLFFLNPKFKAFIYLWCLYRSVCAKPVRKPHCLMTRLK